MEKKKKSKLTRNRSRNGVHIGTGGGLGGKSKRKERFFRAGEKTALSPRQKGGRGGERRWVGKGGGLVCEVEEGVVSVKKKDRSKKKGRRLSGETGHV